MRKSAGLSRLHAQETENESVNQSTKEPANDIPQTPIKKQLAFKPPRLLSASEPSLLNTSANKSTISSHKQSISKPATSLLHSKPASPSLHQPNNLSTPKSLHQPKLTPSKPAQSIVARYHKCMYCARTKKKHKNWLDGVLVMEGRNVSLYDEHSKTVTKKLSNQSTDTWSDDVTVSLGNWDIEICQPITEQMFLSGTCFITHTMADDTITAPTPKINTPFKSVTTTKSKSIAPVVIQAPPSVDFNDPSLFILNRKRCDPSVNKGKLENPVIVDQFLTRCLRPHQFEGLQFLYDCTMGLRQKGSHGCILADEMGLGKTLQSLAIIWTLLRQGPAGDPVIKKAVIVCPSTLVANWKREINKWIGNSRLTPAVIDASMPPAEQQNVVSGFIIGSSRQVLICSYEMYRKHAENLQTLGRDRSLLICDEGHRLKNSKGNATIDALSTFDSARRVLLTGTPVQNDLMEFFAMAEFVNPGCLGAISAFRRTFEQPIQDSRDQNATPKQCQLGKARSEQLVKMTEAFVLRRSADILRKYLPTKHEHVLFCPLSSLQTKVYQAILSSKALARIFRQKDDKDHDALALQCINSLKQVCNHPRLVFDAAEKVQLENVAVSELSSVSECFEDGQPVDIEESGKLSVLFSLIDSIRAANQKCVIVSNYVRTLDLIAEACKAKDFGFVRLDGSTAQDKRQPAVDRFNATQNDDFLFLLSSKAGGQGLNLVSASSLVLVDPDWNPATDQQAMARVWRDGQVNHVHIYRLISTGSIDEKIFQRQIRKQEIASAVSTGSDKRVKGDDEGKFSQASLKALFVLKQTTACDTYDLLTRQADEKNESTGSDDESLPVAQVIDDRHLLITRRVWDVVWDSHEVNQAAIAAVPSKLISAVFTITTEPEKADISAVVEVSADDQTNVAPSVVADGFDDFDDCFPPNRSSEDFPRLDVQDGDDTELVLEPLKRSPTKKRKAASKKGKPAAKKADKSEDPSSESVSPKKKTTKRRRVISLSDDEDSDFE